MIFTPSGSVEPSSWCSRQNAWTTVSFLGHTFSVTVIMPGAKWLEDRERKKKEWRLVHILPINAPLVKQNDSLPQDFSCLIITTAATLLPMERLNRRKKRNENQGIPPAPSLWSLGVPLFLGSETEDFTWSSFCQPLVHTSEFLAAFGCRLGNTGGKKIANSLLAELWILVSFPHLRATIYVSGPSKSCSVHSIQDL